MKTVSLKTAKQLKEAGFPQKTYWYWYTGTDGHSSLLWIREDEKFMLDKAVAAPTVEEIAITFDFKKLSEEDILKAYGHAFNVPTTRKITAWGLQLCMSDPEIAARMYLWLKENNLL